jgi:hypothetical protein
VVTPGSILIAGRNGIELDRLTPSQLLRRWTLKNEGSVMSTKKPAVDDKKATTIVANDPDDPRGTLKRIGGSQSDHWIKHSDKETQDQQCSATVAALIGIGPKDELEGMIAAQLLAAHNAVMECYRRAMLGEQTFEGRRENLSQANTIDERRRLASLIRNSRDLLSRLR